MRPHRTSYIPLSGYRGVTKNGSGFKAQIDINSKRVYLGSFKTALEAHEAYERRYEEYKKRGY